MDIATLLAEKPLSQVEAIHQDTPIKQVAHTLLGQRTGALIVTETSGAMQGIVSERDLIQVVASCDRNFADRPVSEIMTRSVITCRPSDEIAFVLHLMNKNAIRHMPVLDVGKLVGMISIRELTTAYELLEIEANTDPLTAVSNRRPFLKTVEAEFARARRFGHEMTVAMIDIDHFKRVNDTYGHEAGDQVLQDVAQILINEFRSIDLVCRLGGEEFALLFPETDRDGAQLACARLLDDVRAANFATRGGVVKISVSIGLAGAQPGHATGFDVLKRADELLYIAKGAGRDCLAVDPPSGTPPTQCTAQPVQAAITTTLKNGMVL